MHICNGGVQVVISSASNMSSAGSAAKGETSETIEVQLTSTSRWIQAKVETLKLEGQKKSVELSIIYP